jgi:hypothetical protein
MKISSPEITDVFCAFRSRLSRQCGILSLLQPYSPSRPVMGIALLHFGSGLEYLRRSPAIIGGEEKGTQCPGV